MIKMLQMSNRVILFSLKTLLYIVAWWSMPQANAQTSPWPSVNKEMRPWTRWWWMGNAVNEEEIRLLLDTYHRAGFGGVEIAPIYGVNGFESRFIQYLSPQWMNVLNVTVKKTVSLGMGVDLTNGTGWPFGGPQITLPYAASKLIVQQYTIAPGLSFSEKIRVKDPHQENASLQFLTAYSDKGQVMQLENKVNDDGSLNWKPEKDTWHLFAVFNGKTRQMVKRSSPGGEGYTLDHFSQEALGRYLSRYDSAFHNKAPGIRAFYNDSYEVYGADWSANLTDLFNKNRGYDLRPWIRYLISKEPSDTVARLKSDYRETMSEMLLNNFTRAWTSWAHRYQRITRNQAHGSPGNLLDLYAAVDIPECETFGSSHFSIPGLRRDSADVRNVDPDPVMLRFASSAAHVSGRPLVSCETFTWLTEHFKTSLAQCKPEVEQVFLSGINHVFFHGTTYSPPAAPWPGWLFYASTEFVPSNSFWGHLTSLTSYITRVQSVLQSGLPDNELLIYWPIYDAWNRSEGLDMPLKVHDIDQWLHPSPFYKDVIQLLKTGYSLDFVSDHLLSNAFSVAGNIITSSGSPTYKTLVIPSMKLMPVETMEKILDLARKGATVVFQELPADVPGLGTLDQRRARLKELIASLRFQPVSGTITRMSLGAGSLILSNDLESALDYVKIQPEHLTDVGLQYIRRKKGTDIYYYLVNHTPKVVKGPIPLNARASSVTIMDPQTGESGKAVFTVQGKLTKVKINMQSGEALILRVSTTSPPQGKPWKYLDHPMDSIEIKGPWALRFTHGGPALPSPRTLQTPLLWTSFNDSAAVSFSGSGEYTVSFNLPASPATEYLLRPTGICESARVWVNGTYAGDLWSIPFNLRIGKYLRPGRNTLKIEVANLMANRIRFMDRKGIPWKKFKDINIVDINYKPLNASTWTVLPSGLQGPVWLISYRD